MPNYPGAPGTTAAPTYTATPGGSNPAYPGQSATVVATSPQSLSIGDTVVVFNAEQPAVPQRSIPVFISQGPDVTGQSVFISVEILFSGAPGAFEVDVQDSDTDADGMYQTITAGAITSVGANQSARGEFQIKGKFVSLLLKSRANAVNLTAKVSR